MVFNFDFINNPIILVVLGVALIAMLVLVIDYRAVIARVARYKRRNAATPREPKLPALSVIVYSKDMAVALESLLPEILDQDYPAPFEVIVATDGRSMHAEDVVIRLSNHYRNIRMTYVPDDAHSLSRKKLAVTLGVKAARYENVVLTDASVRIPSSHWLLAIGTRIAEGFDVIIGSNTVVGSGNRHERWLAAFDTLAATVSRLSSAINLRPYRATDKSMAFTRSLFFNNRGFADSVSLHHGIDDIFISRIANYRNCAVEISDDAIVEVHTDDLRLRHLFDKLQHTFTGSRVSRRMSRRMAMNSLTMWVWLAATVAAGILGWPNLVPLAAAIFFGLVWMGVTVFAWSRAARALRLYVNRWLLVPAMFMWPLYNLIYRLRARRNRSSNFTWTKGF